MSDSAGDRPAVQPLEGGRPAGPSLLGSVALAAAAAMLVALVLFARLPAWPKIFGVLNDAAHAPVFGGLAALFLLAIRRLTSVTGFAAYALAFVATVATGIAVEIVQGYIGRDSSWSDVWTNTLGAAGVLAAIGRWEARRLPSTTRPRLLPATLAAVVTACIALVAAPIVDAGLAYARRASSFPTVLAFEVPRDLYFMEVRDARLSRRPLPTRWARPGDGRSALLQATSGPWPGLAHSEPVRDWRDHGSLMADLTNPMDRPLAIVIRVHDLAHNQEHADRFNRSFELPAHTRLTLSVSLADIAAGPKHRTLDLSGVAGVIVFAPRAEDDLPPEFFLTRVWLE